MFNGNCSEAMKFYQKALGGDLQMMPYAEAPMPEFNKNKDLIMHATLRAGNVVIMGADTTPEKRVSNGTNVHISFDCESMDEIQKVFSALSQGGKITMPLQDTFWGAHFGMLTDKYGHEWMFNYDKNQK